MAVRLSGRALLGALAILFLASPGRAATEEIQVYQDDLTAPGRFGTDLHNNYVPRDRVYRFTPEFYYGASRDVELGLYVLTARLRDRAAVLDGGKLRIKYVAPHAENGAYWGANVEAGRTTRRVSDDRWNDELKAIAGGRLGPWVLAANLDADGSLERPQLGAEDLGLDLKISRELSPGAALGLESYDELGPLRAPGAFADRGHTLYAVFDGTIFGADLNAGAGRGLTPSADPWTLKFIVGLHF